LCCGIAAGKVPSRGICGPLPGYKDQSLEAHPGRVGSHRGGKVGGVDWLMGHLMVKSRM
jgi:hypothetical protein